VKLRLFVLPFVLAVAGLAVSATVDGRLALAAGALPECRYDDVMTRFTEHWQWKKTLLDTIYKLPRSYMPPPSLRSTDDANMRGGEKLRRFVIADLKALGQQSRMDGVRIRIVSGYRGWDEQNYLYKREVRQKGLEAGRAMVARPGHSEHHLGTAIDFGSPDDDKAAWNYDDWADTPAGAWLYKNAWKFGFVLSYPKGQRDTTCYAYEPWHYRYIGRDMAADLHGTGLTLREYLWQRFH
jgi:D-alanyl-D-alanine carboxypeptidase